MTPFQHVLGGQAADLEIVHAHRVAPRAGGRPKIHTQGNGANRSSSGVCAVQSAVPCGSGP